MTTKGDQILDRPLAEIGGKGLFIKELEVAMEEGNAHLAVHSMKDVPMVMPEGFVLAAISARENPRDAFVSNNYAGLDELPAGAVVGTSSLRRESILRAKFPQLVIKSLRGNLDTRLRKLDAGEYDAIILAAAGLIRLGLENRIKSVLTAEQSLPAPGQGALGIELVAVRDMPPSSHHSMIRKLPTASKPNVPSRAPSVAPVRCRSAATRSSIMASSGCAVSSRPPTARKW